MKSKYGFIKEFCQDLFSVGFRHRQLLQILKQIRSTQATAFDRGRPAHQENSLSMFGHCQSLVRLQFVEDLGLFSGEFPRSYLSHVR